MSRPAPGAALARYEDDSEALAKRAHPLLAGLRSGRWLDEQEFPPLAYAIPGIVPEGFVILAGAPKIGKSWHVLSHALAVASGGVTLGAHPVGRPRPVLYLALEDGDRRMQDRCRRLLGPGEPIPEGFEYLTRVKPHEVIPTVVAWLDLYPGTGAFVILDTLGKVMPTALPGESSYQRDYRIGGELKEVCDQRPGMTMLVNHHDRKAAADDFVDSVSATHGLAGSADAVLVLSRPRLEGQEGRLKVTGRDVPEAEYALKLVDGMHWTLDGEDLAAARQRATDARVTAGLGDRMAEVIGYVQQHPAGVSPTDVAAAFGLEGNQARCICPVPWRRGESCAQRVASIPLLQVLQVLLVGRRRRASWP